MKIRFIVLPGLLLLTAASSMAMSLGRHSGAMLIGRPLDMSVQAVLQAQDDVGNLCLEADVFYADNKLDKSRVRVTLEKPAFASEYAPQQALIRIRSAVVIDEPVVTVYLRVGCQLKTERRYVSLAELVSEAAPDKNPSSGVPSAASAVPVRPALAPPLNVTNPTVGANVPRSGKSAKSANSANSANSAKNSRSAASASTAPVEPALVPQLTEQTQTPGTKVLREPTVASNSKSAAPARSRLKLEPLDLVMERDPQLKSSAVLLSIPAANPQERAAASALWRALSAQPQDILRDTEKLQSLESSVRGLQAQSQKTLLSIDDLNAKLQKSQEQRYSNPLVYALATLLLAVMAGLVYLLRGSASGRGGESKDKPWWRKNDVYKGHRDGWIDSSPLDDQSHLAKLHKAPRRSDSPVSKSALADVNVDFDLDPTAVRSRGSRVKASPAFVNSIPLSSKDRSDFGSSLLHPSRAVKAEELFDVQQQADFFVSIGQHEQAIELLRSHIAENVETSALVYLDLFNLYHQIKRPAEYESLRSSFNQRFNAQIPAFELYTDKHLGLEAYQHALSRIEALWPSPKVLEIIEESLFRQPHNNADAFNLEAYRELLMLYSVAKEIISPERVGAVPGKKFDLPDRSTDSVGSSPMTFKPTAIQPLSASMDPAQHSGQDPLMEPWLASVIPPISRRLGLDIDLSQLSAPGGTLNLVDKSDAQFFANLDADATAELPAIDAPQAPPGRAATDADNLIDFEIFDAPISATDKPVPPKI